MKTLYSLINQPIGFVYPNKVFTALFINLIVLLIQFSCFAATLDLTWDTNTDASYYIVYWGETSGAYTHNSQPISSPSTSYTATVEDGKTYYIAVKAFNDCGNSSDFSQELVHALSGEPPSATNSAPAAHAGADQNVSEGSLVTLNASASSDPDDGIAAYQWSQTSGTAVTLSNASAIFPTFTAPETGLGGQVIGFSLRITDFGGLSSTDTCLVSISHINQAPVANAGLDQTVDEGALVSLNGRLSSDADDGIASYQWAQTAGTPVSLSSTSMDAPTFTAPDTVPDGENLVFSLQVTDKSGVSSSDQCLVHVSFVNDSPFADAGTEQTVDEGQVVTLNAGSSSDPDDGIASYVWFQTQGPSVALSTTTDIAPTFTAPQVGTEGLTLTFQLVIEDTQGAMSADTVDIHVKDSAIVNMPPPPVSPETATVLLSEFPTIEVLDLDFQHLLWLKIGWSEYTSVHGEARVATGDIDNDGQDEIIIGLAQVADAPSIPGGFFQVLDHDYSHLTWGYVNWPEYNAINGETWPACGDLDGDGDDEIVIGLGPGGEGNMEVFDYENGDIFHKEWIKGAWTDYNQASGAIRPVLGDLNLDGKDDIIAGLYSVSTVPELPGGHFEIIDSSFSHIMWGHVAWPEYNAINGETIPAMGHMSNLQTPQIVIGLGSGGRGRLQIFDYGTQGPVHKDWVIVDWTEYNDLLGESRPALADIDGDGHDELMIGLGPVKRNRSIPNGLFQASDSDLSILSWGQVSWDDYIQKNGETRLSLGTSQGTPSIYVSLGKRQEKTTGGSKSPPGKSKK